MEKKKVPAYLFRLLNSTTNGEQYTELMNKSEKELLVLLCFELQALRNFAEGMRFRVDDDG